MDEPLRVETLAEDVLKDEFEQAYLVITSRHVEARGYCLYVLLLGAFLTAFGALVIALNLAGAL